MIKGLVDPTFVSKDEAEMRGLDDQGWYGLDDNGHIAGGPYDTREECVQAFEEHKRDERT